MSSETCNESTRKVYKSEEMYPDCEKKKKVASIDGIKKRFMLET